MITAHPFSSAMLLSILFFSLNLHGSIGGGWQNAHATFYGGGDASGTMGDHYSLLNHLDLIPI